MNNCSRILLATAITALIGSNQIHADTLSLTDAIAGGNAFGDLRLRYENVDSGSVESDVLMLRSRVGYKTAVYEGFSALVEFEDARDALGITEDPNNPNAILDAEMTEVDQGFIQYKNTLLTTKLGRQVIALDNQRHIGHVGWRNDRQTFDAARISAEVMTGLKVDAAYIYRVNRINTPVFSDLEETSHKLLNISYASSIGKIAVYDYELSKEGPFDETSTVGLSLNGKTGEDIKISYAFEYAQQDNKTVDADMKYMLAELGVSVVGLTGKLGYEVMGSDAGKESFSTPLATVHKFAGWADVFAAPSLFGSLDGGNGLVDTYASVTGKLAGVKLAAVYHDFESDELSKDLGSEIDLLVAKKFSEIYSGGLKYADYSAASGGVDKTVMWAWLGMKF